MQYMVNFTVSSNQPENSVVLILTVHEEAVSELDETYVYESVRKAYSDNLLCSIQSEYPPYTALLTTPVFINVTLEACPLGFELSKLTGMCDCARGLKAIEDMFLTCEIRDHVGYINREGTVWVGVDTRENNTGIYYWHRYCPRDYCIRSPYPH